jgi:hypothetical protein
MIHSSGFQDLLWRSEGYSQKSLEASDLHFARTANSLVTVIDSLQ